MDETTARRGASMPSGTISILERRTLAKDFRILSQVLQIGQSVVDFGCGSGAITVDIAKRVNPGSVVGVDINFRLLEEARGLSERKGLTNLSFIEDHVYDCKLTSGFDVVASARMLQWLEFPAKALTYFLSEPNEEWRVGCAS